MMGKRLSDSGQYYPIIRSNNKILDGRIRLLLCIIAEVKPKFTDLQLTEEQEADIVFRLNMDRRNMGLATRLDIGIEIQEWIESISQPTQLEDSYLDKIQTLAQDKELAEKLHTTTKTLREYKELKKKAKINPSIDKSLQRLKTGKKKASVKRLYKKFIEIPKKPQSSIKLPPRKTKLDLRQELEDVKEEKKLLYIKKATYENLYNKVKEIAINKDYWDDILKELIPTIKKKKSPFPTIKQLREAGLI